MFQVNVPVPKTCPIIMGKRRKMLLLALTSNPIQPLGTKESIFLPRKLGLNRNFAYKVHWEPLGFSATEYCRYTKFCVPKVISYQSTYTHCTVDGFAIFSPVFY